MVTIVDYGMGNLGSIQNMLKKVGESSKVSSDIQDIGNASKLLLPGVGSFDNAMHNLKTLNLIETLKHKVQEEGTPILGICLGMQLLTKGSEEGLSEGLGFIDAYSEKFDFRKLETVHPIPHMGWNRVKIQKQSRLFNTITQRNRFYFVHSYAIRCNQQEDILTTSKYGYEFVSSFERDNVLGCQFHPEKSHKFGINLFKNFVENY